MIKFKVGVEVEQTRWTVVVVEVEAASKDEAEHKAVDKVAQICPHATSREELGLGPRDDWCDEGGFVCVGPNRDEDWDSEDYEPNIRM
jgi:hypothetical protein